jgi:hypothetical protein
MSMGGGDTNKVQHDADITMTKPLWDVFYIGLSLNEGDW